MSVCTSQQFIAYHQAYDSAKKQELSLTRKKINLLFKKLRVNYIAATMLLICSGIVSCISLVLAISSNGSLIFAVLYAASLLLICISTLILFIILNKLQHLPSQEKTVFLSINKKSNQFMQLFQNAYLALSNVTTNQQQRLEKLTQTKISLIDQLKESSLRNQHNQ